MSVHNDVCGIVILYEEGDCVVLTTSESRNCMMHGFIRTETITICLPAIFYLLWKRLATRLSLVSSQNALDVVRFFRKVKLFSS